MIEIVYDDFCGTKVAGVLPLHGVVDFPDCTLNHTFIPGSPTTYMSIPITNTRCEKNMLNVYTTYDSL